MALGYPRALARDVTSIIESFINTLGDPLTPVFILIHSHFNQCEEAAEG